MQSNLTGKRKNDNAVHVLRRSLPFMAEQNCPFPVQGLAIAPSCTQPHRRRHCSATPPQEVPIVLRLNLYGRWISAGIIMPY